MGDFGRTIGPGDSVPMVPVPVLTGAVPARSTPGVGALVDDALLCCDPRPRAFLNAAISALSGERDGLRAKKPLGGDLGDSTCTAGVSFGEDPINMERGRLWFDRDGDSEPLFAEPGIRVPFGVPAC